MWTVHKGMNAAPIPCRSGIVPVCPTPGHFRRKRDKASDALTGKLRACDQNCRIVTTKWPRRAPEKRPVIAEESKTIDSDQDRPAGSWGRHWRGELTLGAAYWGNGVLLAVVIGLVTGLFAKLVAVGTNSVALGVFLAILFWTFFIPLFIWQVVGIWRSANRHTSRGGTWLAAALAKFVLVMAVVNTGKHLGETGGVIAVWANETRRESIEEQAIPLTDEAQVHEEEKVDQAAEAAGARDIFQAGMRHYEGTDGPRNFTQAVVFFRQAAEAGLAEAQHNLAVCLMEGEGGRQNHHEAVEWFQKAAAQGLASAQFALGKSYYDGKGVAQDQGEAIKWWRRAAQQGEAEAQRWLGYSYSQGKGVPKDDREAARWWKAAALQGDLVAQSNLAIAYWEGKGVTKNLAEAYAWLVLMRAQATPADGLKVQGISGGVKYLAIINGVTVGSGDVVTVRTRYGEVSFRCLTVQADRVRFLVAKETTVRTLHVNGSGSEDRPEIFEGVEVMKSAFEARLSAGQLAEARQRASDLASRIARGEDDSGDPSMRPSGTGFFVTASGYVVTCEHVVRDASAIWVNASGRLLPATLIRADQTLDLALLKVEGRFHPLPVPPETPVQLGEKVMTVGFPNPSLQGIEPKLTRGEISSRAGMRDDPTQYQISVPVQPGNSGGALVDELGNVVGVVTSRLNYMAALKESGTLPQNVNYAVKGHLVYDFVRRSAGAGMALKPAQKRNGDETAEVMAERATVRVLVE
jgi:S1-C subfamily serine protease